MRSESETRKIDTRAKSPNDDIFPLVAGEVLSISEADKVCEGKDGKILAIEINVEFTQLKSNKRNSPRFSFSSPSTRDAPQR